MRAITIRQPWASLIALGLKNVETRSWTTTHRGTIAIHAAAGMPPLADIPKGKSTLGDVDIVRDRSGIRIHHPSLAWPYLVPRGVIVATAEVLDCLPMVTPGAATDLPCIEVADAHVTLHANSCDDDGFEYDLTGERALGDYTPGRYGWMLVDIQPIRRNQPAARGQLGLWNWTPEQQSAPHPQG